MSAEPNDIVDDTLAAMDKPLTLSITFERSEHGMIFAFMEGADISSGWCRTPEAAAVALLEKCRDKLADMNGSAWRSVHRDGKIPVYIALTHLLR